ncbi:hypothetical protein R0K19_28110, partial [Bacillus sp. SIMBA_161]
NSPFFDFQVYLAKNIVFLELDSPCLRYDKIGGKPFRFLHVYEERSFSHENEIDHSICKRC